MSNILENKLEELENSQDYECWYLVKQPTDFPTICYLVSFLKDYKNNEDYKNNFNLEEYINNRVEQINKELEVGKISKNYRALRVATFYGLIKMTDSKYENAIITETFYEIKEVTKGKYENIDLYQDIITRQIEKMFVSSPIDEEYKGVRKKYKLYPVMLLYKVLIELGRFEEDYFITRIEYRYLVATTKNYNDVLKTLLEISELRDNPSYNNKLDKYKFKFDNRMIQALKQLDTLTVNSGRVEIKPEKIEEIRRKVFIFESINDSYYKEKYIDFLVSRKSLFDIVEESNDYRGVNVCTKVTSQQINEPHQRIFFGAPGTGKSFKLNKEAKESFGNNYERVTFHPNYMYGNFVGAFKPFPKVLKDEAGRMLEDDYGNTQETITYKYIPGPLMRTLVKALKNREINYLVLIEEINRANVAAVFGDFFQLLDRKENGESEYAITTSEEVKKYLERSFLNVDPNIREYISSKIGSEYERLILPSNLYIWSTMNSADQGVMPMDTAFKRRWEFTYIGIDDVLSDAKIASEFNQYRFRISKSTTVKWNDFRTEVNKRLSSCGVPEDKLLGPYFISRSVLESDNIDEITNSIKNKVLMYLYEDAGKPYRSNLFVAEKSRTYSALCKNFDEDGKGIFIKPLEIEEDSI